MTPAEEDGGGYVRPGRPAGRMRLPRLFVIGLSLVLAGVAGVFFWSQQARVQLWEGRARAMRGQLAQAQQQAESLHGQLAQAAAAQRTLTEQLEAAQRQAAAAQQTAATLERQQVELSSKYAALQGESATLTAKLDAALKERDALEQQATALRRERDDLETRRRSLEQRYASLAGTSAFRSPAAPAAGGPRGAIELPPIIVHHPTAPPAPEQHPSDAAAGAWGDRPAAAPASEAPPAARIVEVNERYAFVVVDRGSADGVAPGLAFDIVRDGLVIGSVTVRQVRERLCACDAGFSAGTAMRFRVGDTAVPRRD